MARPGDAVLWQWIRSDGAVCGAIPMTLVADEPTIVAWIAPGTPMIWPDGRDDEGGLRPIPEWGHAHRAWEGDGVLSLTPPDRRHAIWIFFGDDGGFRGWYVHLQAPTRRRRDRFQTTDWQLDLIIRPDGDVVWKDEDDLARAVEVGIHAPDVAEAAYAEAHRVLEEWPFPTGWEDWRPEPGWPIPPLPEDWARSDRGLP